MTGPELYEMYELVCLQDNCGVDVWTDLDEITQGQWERLARQLTRKGEEQ